MKKRVKFSAHPKWKLLEARGEAAIRDEIFDWLRRLSIGRSIGSGRWDQQKPAWLPTCTMIVQLFKVSGWADVLKIAGLPPAQKGMQRGQKRNSMMVSGEDVIADMQKKCIPPDWDRRALVVKANDTPEPEPKRYWDPNAHCYREHIVYKGGHFGQSGV